VAAWFVAAPWQRLIADLAGRAAVPAGSHVEWVDLQTFFPFDLSIFVALCLASTWVSWRARLRTLGVGLAALIVLEWLTLVVVIKVMLAGSGQPEAQADATQRLVAGVIRFTGLVAAGCAWLYLLGWQRVPQFAERLAARGRGARGGKR